ncbi:MAG: SOS response-associated peptidase family protein [Marinomonas sp.]
MTMLYRLDANAAMIAGNFAASAGEDQWAGGYIAPGKFAPIVTGGREFIAGPRGARTKPRLTPRLWGVPPPPNADDPSRGITNVRNHGSPFWTGNLRNSEFRCLIPASVFMEWGKYPGKDGRREQHWFAVSDQELFAFAGVWKDSEIPSFALLTCPANAELRRIGLDRMPVILPNDGGAHEAWLFADWKRAEALLQPYSSSMMRAMKGSNSA